MTKNRHFRTALGAIGMVSLSIVGYPAVPKWEKEPKQIFGITVGIKTQDLGLPSCTVPPNGQVPAGPTCLVYPNGPNAHKFITVANLPDVLPGEMSRYGEITVKEGMAADFTIKIKKSGYVSFKSILTERYGPPTTQRIADYQNGFGATFRYETAIWSGESVGILLSEHEDSNYSSVSFFSVAMMDRLAVEKDKAIKEGASKL